MKDTEKYKASSSVKPNIERFKYEVAQELGLSSRKNKNKSKKVKNEKSNSNDT